MSFFDVAKLFWAIFAPSHLLLWLALATAIALVAGRVRLGRGLAVVTALLFVVFGMLPLGAMIARSLENEYPRPALPAHVDGILTLGGGLETRIELARGAPGPASSVMRLVSTMALARRYPNARVVFSGGWGRFADARAAGELFGEMGLDPARLTLEANSRDTYENFVFSKRLARPKPGQVWVLATSALQMPRAMAVAQRVGWPMIPWATDYTTTPKRGPISLYVQDYLNVDGNLVTLDHALHEWLGMIAYRLAHRADAPAGVSRPS